MLLLSSCQHMISNVSSCHKADRRQANVRYERKADIDNSLLCELSGSRSEGAKNTFELDQI